MASDSGTGLEGKSQARCTDEPARERKPMTGWYDPGQLTSTGIRVASSTVFGAMFDRRELMASLDPFEPPYFDDNCDFSDLARRSLGDADGNFWLDYCVDTGDGWQSTYAVARLLARQDLEVEEYRPSDAAAQPMIAKHLLPQGRVLVFGGDEVYPTASDAEYEDRLQEPFRQANRKENANTADNIFDKTKLRFSNRHVYAIPGNHDWYDGLTAFTRLFCAGAPLRTGAAPNPGRAVAGRQSTQTRSYFALKLPGNWWLCAFDAQLSGYLDGMQMRFFEYLAQEKMAAGSNVILCFAAPVWEYCRDWAGEPKDEPADGFSNFAFASLIVTGGFSYKTGNQRRTHNLRLVLTGDAHHYAHFTERSATSNAKIDYLTCGLGGAFLHPTHHLTDTTTCVRWAPPQPLTPPNGPFDAYPQRLRRNFTLERAATGKPVVYPDIDTSRGLARKGWQFVWHNRSFARVPGIAALLATWLLHFGASVMSESQTLAFVLRKDSLGDALSGLWHLFWVTPLPLVIVLGLCGALYYLADHKNTRRRAKMGVSHAAIHVLVYFVLLIAIARALHWLPWVKVNSQEPSGWWDLNLIVLLGLIEAIVSSTILGLYFAIWLNRGGLHWNEAFSALRIADYKGFLRLKIDKAGDLTVYPIAVDRVPNDDNAALSPHLIEPPILISKRP